LVYTSVSAGPKIFPGELGRCPEYNLKSLEEGLDLLDNFGGNFYFNALILCPAMFVHSLPILCPAMSVQSLPIFDTAGIPQQCMNSVLTYTAATLVVSSNFNLPVLKVATFRNDFLR
jgi:hypothetical protein